MVQDFHLQRPIPQSVLNTFISFNYHINGMDAPKWHAKLQLTLILPLNLKSSKIPLKATQSSENWIETPNNNSQQKISNKKWNNRVFPTRNDIIKEIQWQKQWPGKKNEEEPKNIYIIVNLKLIPIFMKFMNYLA